MAKRKIRSVVIDDHRDGEGGGLHEEAENFLERIVLPEPEGAVKPDAIVFPEPDGAAVIEDKGDGPSRR